MSKVLSKHQAAISALKQKIDDLTEDRNSLLNFIDTQDRMLNEKRATVEEMALDILSLRSSLEKLENV